MGDARKKGTAATVTRCLEPSGPRETQPSGRRPPAIKRYFKIGEVVALVGVEAHVLRYWEKEVPGIRPGKSASNQRRYRLQDIERFREVRRLLYEEKYTLAGAKIRLAEVAKAGHASVQPPAAPQGRHQRLRTMVEDLIACAQDARFLSSK